MISKLLTENLNTNQNIHSRIRELNKGRWAKLMPKLESYSTQNLHDNLVMEGSYDLNFNQFVGKDQDMFISETAEENKVVARNNDKPLEYCKPEITNNEKLKRFVIVNEGINGISSVAEICRREGISQSTFLEWNKELVYLRREISHRNQRLTDTYKINKAHITDGDNEEYFEYWENYFDFSDNNGLILSDEGELTANGEDNRNHVVFLNRINNVRYINKFLEDVNENLEIGGLFGGCFETFAARKQKLRISKIPLISSIYFILEFVFKRIVPKLSFTKKYYFSITKGNDRLLSKAEGLGRLVSCGFKIMDYKSINGLIYFIVKKEGSPVFDSNPSYGPLFGMPRIGKNGKIFKVYKFRTMHPYSEYLQDYIVKANGYAKTGKPANDFRIPKWAEFMRRYWLDELPQLINVVKGDLKLVGVRPVSQTYFKGIPKEMQKLRLTQKPGCIPPYVALNRDANVLSVLQAEKDYLEEKIRNPFTTDSKYFVSALINIIFKNKRSA